MNTRIPGRRLLHSPGPSPLPDEVLHALTRQPMDLADPRVDDCISACDAGLQRLLNTPAGSEVFFYACNGHGAWEAAIVNLLDEGELALVPGTGHFSEQWALQTEALGRRVLRTGWTEGTVMDAGAVRAALAADREHRIRAVFAVHTDTASGIRHDPAPLRAALDATGHPALLVVDGVASVGTEALDMAALGVDAVLGASQKGLMCPPGVGFLVLAPRALEGAMANPAPRAYWDIRQRRGRISYVRFYGTPPLNLMYAMQAAFGLIERETFAAVLARHERLKTLVRVAMRGWAEGGALRPLAADDAIAANAVSAIVVPNGFDVDTLRTLARERFQVAVAGGLGPFFGRVFRIGHLGDQNEPQVLGALAGIEAALRTLGVPIGQGVGAAVAAAAEPRHD